MEIQFARHYFAGDPHEISFRLSPRRAEAMIVYDCAALRDPKEILDGWAEALSFPRYYGRNWDALDECVGDLCWLHRDVVFVLANAQRLRTLSEERFGTAVEILASLGESPWEPLSKPYLRDVCGHASDPATLRDLPAIVERSWRGNLPPPCFEALETINREHPSMEAESGA